MNKFVIVAIVGLFLIGFVSSYMCINPTEDNPSVVDFKNKVNILAMKEEIKNGVTPEVFDIKMKYFGPCR